MAYRALSFAGYRIRADAPAVDACVNAMYQDYIARIGGRVGPMSESYKDVIRR
jgi:hypothetical protein